MNTNRRDFIKGAATAMAVLPTFKILSQDNPLALDVDPINVALIGCGAQGSVLSEAATRIPGIRFRAICDIWRFNQDRMKSFFRGMKHDITYYVDYREMLEKEDKNIDAVIIATPDWMHAEHANACLRAGKHVYCEKPMSNRIEDAKSMVQTQRETGKLLQIGHQRRSNPRYTHAINRVLREAKMLGSVPHAYAQWHRAVAPFLTVRERMFVPAETLERYGYENMEQLLNWRWFAKYGGGPMLDLGSHQVDLFLWAWDSDPVSVTAVGGNEFYGRQMNDNVTASFEFRVKDGKTSRGLYQVLTTTSSGSFYERFMGEDGTLQISEVSVLGDSVERAPYSGRPDLLPRWNKLVSQGLLRELPKKPPAQKWSPEMPYDDMMCRLDPSEMWVSYLLPVGLTKPAHQPHLENFFDAIRLNRPDLLTCPADVAYRTNVAVLAANESVTKRQTITFKPDDFRA
ncbi:MAG: Gfo/Idh/MocA family oxidoreductase [Kiritimatiellaeota bacterium]|nr:Gfo/Idh/MocA family oxidoreductase [Kiritimatiellota bacterium]